LVLLKKLPYIPANKRPPAWRNRQSLDVPASTAVCPTWPRDCLDIVWQTREGVARCDPELFV